LFLYLLAVIYDAEMWHYNWLITQ